MAKTRGSLVWYLLVDDDEPPLGLDLFGQKAQIGLIADGHDHRIGRKDLAVWSAPRPSP